MRNLMRVISPLLTLLIAAGCAPLFPEPSCSEFRQVTSTGDVGGSGSPRLGRLELDLTEPRDSTLLAEISITGFGPDSTAGPLRGHIAKVRVTTPTGTELLAPDIRPVPVTEAGSMLFLSSTRVDHASFEQYRERTLAGDIRLELTTDATPGQSFVVVPRVTTAGDWRKVCAK